MNVLNIASPTLRVSRDAPDAAERIIAALDHALVDAGHTSLVIGAHDSTIEGLLLAVPDADDASPVKRTRAAQAITRAVLREALDTMRVDVVHFHGFDMASYLPVTGVPMLATLHFPVPWYTSEVLAGGLHIVCVASSQRRALPDDVRHSAQVITNGVDTALFAPLHHKHDYVAAIGTLTPERGFHLALEAARLARVPCQLAGEVPSQPAQQHYFRDSIVPRLDSERLFVGPLLGLARRAFLARASALVLPSVIDATSTVIAMEALACGTPVIAMRHGSPPGLIEHGITGYLVDGFLDLAEALQRVAPLSRSACRKAALEHFDVHATTASYLATYERLAAVSPHRRFSIAPPAIAQKS